MTDFLERVHCDSRQQHGHAVCAGASCAVSSRRVIHRRGPFSVQIIAAICDSHSLRSDSDFHCTCNGVLSRALAFFLRA